MPMYAFAFMVFMLASVGLPGTAGFVGEFLVLTGAFKANTWVALFAASGVVLGATYMLLLYRRVIWGAITKDDVREMVDLDRREIAILAPIIIIVMWMGIYPLPFLDVMSESVAHLVNNYQADLKAAGVTPAATEVTRLGGQLLAFLR
jgi:NADH-quinone oxidoreductase subunit M